MTPMTVGLIQAGMFALAWTGWLMIAAMFYRRIILDRQTRDALDDANTALDHANYFADTYLPDPAQVALAELKAGIR